MQQESLVLKILRRLGRVKWFLIPAVILCAMGGWKFANFYHPAYTSRSTIFPLNTQSQGAITSGGGIGSLISGNFDQNFSPDAGINIIELVQSKHTCLEVAKVKPVGFGNRTMAELLINSYNRHKLPWQDPIKMPTDYSALINAGSNMLLSGNISAKTTKTGILEVKFTNQDSSLVGVGNYILVEKLSDFYRELKLAKAEIDKDFADFKLDSVKRKLAQIDALAVKLSNQTRFTPTEKIEYYIPKENLAMEKMRLTSLLSAAINNKEEALWRIQKLNPIIKMLDTPDPPYTVEAVSKPMYAAMFGGLALLLGLIISLGDIFGGMIKKSMSKMLNPEPAPEDEIITTTTSEYQEGSVIYTTKPTATATVSSVVPTDPDAPAIP